jgi:carbon storage regulator
VLVLSRKCEQSLVLGEDIVVTVLKIEGDRVKLGITAPRAVTVMREEIYQQVRTANEAASSALQRPSLQTLAEVIRRRDTTTTDTAAIGAPSA